MRKVVFPVVCFSYCNGKQVQHFSALDNTTTPQQHHLSYPKRKGTIQIAYWNQSPVDQPVPGAPPRKVTGKCSSSADRRTQIARAIPNKLTSAIRWSPV